MGREVRKVPKDWKHPKNEQGYYKPLLDGYNAALAAWDMGKLKWDEGFRDDFNGGWKAKLPDETGTFEDWEGPRPVKSRYMPDWPASQRTHFQMYETTSEGTPISPVMESPESLARWLVDNNASAFADMTASYEGWLRICRGGYAMSMVVDSSGRMTSGVDA